MTSCPNVVTGHEAPGSGDLGRGLPAPMALGAQAGVGGVQAALPPDWASPAPGRRAEVPPWEVHLAIVWHFLLGSGHCSGARLLASPAAQGQGLVLPETRAGPCGAQPVSQQIHSPMRPWAPAPGDKGVARDWARPSGTPRLLQPASRAQHETQRETGTDSKTALVIDVKYKEQNLDCDHFFKKSLYAYIFKLMSEMEKRETM